MRAFVLFILVLIAGGYIASNGARERLFTPEWSVSR